MFQQRVFSLLLLTCVVYSLSPRKVHLQYPTELLHPITGTSFSATVSPDKLLCFGNNDYAAPTYIETLFCMLPYIPGTSTYCNSVWGSRSVEVEVDGNIEFLRVTKLPHESSADATGLRVSDSAYALEISATRWLQYSSHNSVEHPIKELLQIPAEPLYLCARSTDWQGQYANFSMKFRPVYFRMRDKRQCNNRTLMHLALVVMVTSVWFIPYLTAFLAAVLAYEHGLKVMLTLFMVSASVVCLTPLMLTKHNRHLARQYFNYFFTRLQAKETRLQIKKRLPVFQALFFSSLLVVSGFGLVYVLYYYDFLARETRNIGFKTILSAAISWFIFSLCRSFERFLKDWLWIAMCVSLAHLLASHLNPLCRNEVVVASMVLTQALRLLLLPWMAQFETFNRIVSTALPRLENASSKLRIPLPYQIYEHHSLRHLVETDYTAGTISAANSPFSTSLSNTAATSTGDLTNLANNLRRSASSRASLAHIAEMQPLVDYIDEVMEGSICSDDGGEGCEEEQLLEEEETEEREDLVVEEVAAAVREQRGRSPSEQQRSRQVCSATADAATLWQRLCQTDLSPTRNVAAGSTASIEQRNRQALEEQWGLDVTCIPVFKASLLSSTSESSDQQDMQQAPDREVPVVASRRTRSSVKRDAVVPVEASTSPSLSQSGEPGIGRGQLIGAVHTPLSLVGPLSLRLCSPEQDPLLQTTEEDGWQAWLPLAVHEDDMVCALQAACDSVGDSAVTITRLAPLEDKLVVSSRLRCCPQQQSQEGSKSVQAGELAAWLRSDTAIWELLSAAQDEAFDVTCRVESHTTVLLQVRTRLSADAHCILDPLSAGQRILRQILWYIQRSYPSVVAVGGVLVNHSPQSAPVLLQLLPCMHVLQAECSVSLPNTTSAKALLFVHAQVDRHQADAYIIRTLLALCAAMKAESAAAELAVLVACVEFEVVRAPGCGNNADSSAVHVSARVPAMPALCSATADPAVQACLALLAPILREDNTQADDRYAGQQQTTDDSAAQQECAESASAALVLLAYLSYLTMEFTSL